MRVVVALEGNTLFKRGEPMTADAQQRNVKVAAQALAPVANEHQLIISHGNVPQVGLLTLQAAAYEEVDAYPLDVLGFLPVIAPLARFLGLILAFYGVWMSTATAHELRGWRTFLLLVIYLATLIISINFLAAVIKGTVFTIDGLLEQLGWHA